MFCFNLFDLKVITSNQVLYNTRCIAPKLVTNWRSRRPFRVIAPVSFEQISQRWRAVGYSESDSIGPRFKPQTSRSKEEHVTATNWLMRSQNIKQLLFFSWRLYAVCEGTCVATLKSYKLKRNLEDKSLNNCNSSAFSDTQKSGLWRNFSFSNRETNVAEGKMTAAMCDIDEAQEQLSNEYSNYSPCRLVF